jgi:hypothetical protein
MRIAVFLVYMCCLLLGAGKAAYPAASYSFPNSGLHAAAAFLAKDKIAAVNPDLINDTDPCTEKEYFISDDAEEEDASNFVAGKARISSRHYSPLSYRSILNYLHNCFSAPPFFYNRVSDKYILQGVLRI